MKLTLNSGLDVVLEENHAAPVVAFQAWVRAGAADEPAELAGVSHFLEHMLFKGTTRRGVGQIAREVEGAGGEINAWTSYDETVFHLVLASSFFDSGLDILADALTSSSFDPAELERERHVILEEIKQGLDDPDRVASQALFERACAGHPYSRPVIGSAETVAAMKRDDIVRYWRSHYHAGNITLVVVGDFDANQVRPRVEAAFAALPKGKPSKRRPAPAPLHAGPPQVIARDFNKNQFLFGFRAPAVDGADVPALDLLTVVLGQGDSSRLNLEVVRNRQLATSVYSYAFAAKDAGLAVIGATLPPGRVDEAAKATLAEILRLSREELAPEELARARNILEADRVFDKETVQGYARKIGYFAAIAGDLDFETHYFGRLQALSPADLKAVAAKYFRVDNMVTVAQVSEPKAGKQAERATRIATQLSAVVAAAEARADQRAVRPAVTPAADAVVKHTFPSGLKVLVLRDPSVPIVSARALWLGGLRSEDARSNGISNFVAALLTRGTKTRSAEQIMAEVEGMAGSMSGFAGRNSLGVHAEFLSRHWERGLELMSDCLLNASFAEDEIEKERRIVLDELREQEDNLGHTAFRLFHAALWKRHPYRLDLLGTNETVSGFTRRRLQSHYRRFYGPANLTLAIVGDVEPERVIRKLRTLFPEATDTAPEAPQMSAEPAPAEPVQSFKFMAREQAHLVVGFPGTTLDSPDRFALELLAQVLAGQGGRLFNEIREKRALAYNVSAFSLEGIEPGYFAVYVAASPSKLDEALTAIRAELKRAVEEGVTEEELERARRYLIGTHAIGLQRRSAVAAAMAFHEAYGQGYREYRLYPEKLGRVKLADVKRAAVRFLDPGREVIAAVKPGDASPAARGTATDSRAAARAPSRP